MNTNLTIKSKLSNKFFLKKVFYANMAYYLVALLY